MCKHVASLCLNTRGTPPNTLLSRSLINPPTCYHPFTTSFNSAVRAQISSAMSGSVSEVEKQILNVYHMFITCLSHVYHSTNKEEWQHIKKKYSPAFRVKRDKLVVKNQDSKHRGLGFNVWVQINKFCTLKLSLVRKY